MYIDSFSGEAIIDSKDEMITVLQQRSDQGANHFVLTFEDSGFPQLSVFVKNEWCVIYYLGVEAESYVSYNNNLTGRNESVIFYENEKGAQVEIAQECVLSIHILNDVASAFFENQKRSDLINWMEL